MIKQIGVIVVLISGIDLGVYRLIHIEMTDKRFIEATWPVMLIAIAGVIVLVIGLIRERATI